MKNDTVRNIGMEKATATRPDTEISHPVSLHPKYVLLLLVLLGSLILAGCGGEEKEKPSPAGKSPMISQGPHGGTSSAGGVSWTIPEGWEVGAERPMRVATYMVPGSGGDGKGAECAVFHFGEGQGGDVASNIDRWIGQFENPSEPVRTSTESNGLKITTVATTGTFLAPSGPMMQSQGKFENYSLLGAIVEAPGGSVFFKMTGPAEVVRNASDDFNALLRSLK